jgi:hypothetical protein
MTLDEALFDLISSLSRSQFSVGAGISPRGITHSGIGTRGHLFMAENWQSFAGRDSVWAREASQIVTFCRQMSHIAV